MFARRESPLLVWITVLIAVVLTLLPLPQAVSIVWPNLVLLTVLYWSTMAPAIGGVLVGFAAGLALDVLGGAQLGQHAFAFSVLTYLAIKLHLLTRSKPIFEQAIFVLLGLLLYEAILWAIDGFSSRSTGSWLRWMHVPVGAILWPIVVGLLGRLHAPR
ncbi:MAG: rod shape-determining protein MreD [Pseudomonadota bacterium]|jgi:rod shape-determining protein MreD|nr:rod shape-determining protein MreD [Pseudomonadota bacterium]